MLLATLGTSLFRNQLAGKAKRLGGGEGKIKAFKS